MFPWHMNKIFVIVKNIVFSLKKIYLYLQSYGIMLFTVDFTIWSLIYGK